MQRVSAYTLHVSSYLLLSLSLSAGKLDYNAQSPDEAALVSAARNLGYAFTVRQN